MASDRSLTSSLRRCVSAGEVSPSSWALVRVSRGSGEAPSKFDGSWLKLCCKPWPRLDRAELTCVIVVRSLLEVVVDFMVVQCIFVRRQLDLSNVCDSTGNETKGKSFYGDRPNALILLGFDWVFLARLTFLLSQEATGYWYLIINEPNKTKYKIAKKNATSSCLW